MNKMKTKILMLLCLVCTAFCATSCLNSDDNGSTYVPLTPAEKHMICVETSGSYNGYVYFVKEEDKQKADSAAVTFIVSDSTLTMNNYPVKSISPYISDSNAKSVLANAPAAQVNFNFIGYEIQSGSAATGNAYSLWMLPAYNEYKFTTTYTDSEAKSHSIDIYFTNGMQYYSYVYYGMASYQNKQMQANIIVKSVAVDGNTYSVGMVFGMKATKFGY